MCSIARSIRYCEHDVNTRYHACKLYSSGRYTVREVMRRYKVSKASLMRWMRRFDGTRESLVSKSKRPKTPHPNAHTPEEIRHIENLMRRNPDIGLSELYGKLRRDYAYTRHPTSLFRFLRKRGVFIKREHPKKPYKPKPYHTPKQPGVKMQMDVKYVPKRCYTGETNEKFYQYTLIDECTRERFLYAFDELSSHTTLLFLRRAFIYFGYLPKTIQTDHGQEFVHITQTDRKHPLGRFCEELGIEHKTIRPYTPRHNGKIERSHRNDNERFYATLSFYSLADLNHQLRAYLRRSNDIPSSALGWRSPNEKRESLTDLRRNNRKLSKVFTYRIP